MRTLLMGFTPDPDDAFAAHALVHEPPAQVGEIALPVQEEEAEDDDEAPEGDGEVARRLPGKEAAALPRASAREVLGQDDGDQEDQEGEGQPPEEAIAPIHAHEARLAVVRAWRLAAHAHPPVPRRNSPSHWFSAHEPGP